MDEQTWSLRACSDSSIAMERKRMGLESLAILIYGCVDAATLLSMIKY